MKKKSEDSPKKDEVVLNTKKEEEQLATSLPLATSLDIMMKLIFKFIKETCHPNGEEDFYDLYLFLSTNFTNFPKNFA